MVQVVVLSANGEKRTLKTTAFEPGTATGETVAKALRKKVPAEIVATYTFKEKPLIIWGWTQGKANTENKHELPPMAEGEAPLIFGDALAVWAEDFTDDQYDVFYEEAFGGFEDLESEEEEEEEDEEEEEEEVEVEEDENDDCYDDGDENGGGSKRRSPRRKTATADCRRIDMGLRSRVKLPSPPGKRAPKWQTASELEEEEY